MRIALQFSGRLRYTDNSINSLINNIVKVYNPDVFCSLWNPEAFATELDWNSRIQPVSIEYENQAVIRPIIDSLFPFNIHSNMPSMSYKFYKVSKLRRQYENEHNVKYDVVIQARTDNIIFEKLAIPKITSGIWCSNRTYSSDIDPFIQPRMVDNFYLGDSSNIDNSSYTFFHLRYQIQEYLKIGRSHQIRIPEIIQSKIWNDMNIQINSLDGTNPAGDFWYDIDRGPTIWK